MSLNSICPVAPNTLYGPTSGELNGDYTHALLDLEGITRTNIMKFHLKSQENFVYSLELPKLSSWKVLKLALAKVHAEKKGWKTAALVAQGIGIIMLGIAVVAGLTAFAIFCYRAGCAMSRAKIGKFYDVRRYHDYITTDINGQPRIYRIYSHTSYNVEYTKRDFNLAAFAYGTFATTFIAGGLFAAVNIVYSATDFTRRKNPLLIAAEEIKKEWSITKPRLLVKKDSSAAKVDLANITNNKENDLVQDPISLDSIPGEDIQSPKILSIGKYLLSVENALASTLKSAMRRGAETIPHPCELRGMNRDEQQKFLEDISAVFCIADREQLLNCWNSANQPSHRIEFFFRLAPNGARALLPAVKA